MLGLWACTVMPSLYGIGDLTQSFGLIREAISQAQHIPNSGQPLEGLILRTFISLWFAYAGRGS